MKNVNFVILYCFQKLCHLLLVFVNESIETIVYLLNGSADTAVVSGLPPGVTAVFSGDSLIISGSPSVIGIWTYGIFSSGGLCISDTIYGIILVIPKIFKT